MCIRDSILVITSSIYNIFYIIPLTIYHIYLHPPERFFAHTYIHNLDKIVIGLTIFSLALCYYFLQSNNISVFIFCCRINKAFYMFNDTVITFIDGDLWPKRIISQIVNIVRLMFEDCLLYTSRCV